jgi:folate-binding protein YgfZ
MSTFQFAETLLIEGPDAMSFAQAQFSSPVDSLTVGNWQFSAWLDPRGRVRELFHLARLGDARYLLLLRGGEARKTAEELRRFVFRSKLDVSALPARNLATGPAQPMHRVTDDGVVVSLGCDSHSLEVSSTVPGDNAWRLLQLRAGWPWLPASLAGELLAPALSLQRLRAVSTDKGCYPGQEIVARLHFRGGHKRHLHHVSLSRPASAGDRLCRDGREIGCLLDVITATDHTEALAVLSDAVVAQADDARVLPCDDNIDVNLIATWTA